MGKFGDSREDRIRRATPELYIAAVQPFATVLTLVVIALIERRRR